MTIEAEDPAQRDTQAEEQLRALLAEPDGLKWASMALLEIELEAAVAARKKAWNAVLRAAGAGNTVQEVARRAAAAGLGGEEMVRMHIAAGKRLAAVRRIIELTGVQDFHAVPESPRNQSGRITGVRLEYWPEDEDAEMDAAEAYRLLELLRAAGHVPDGADTAQAAELLDEGRPVLLTFVDPADPPAARRASKRSARGGKSALGT